MEKYENRVVLFLDILGFRSIVDKTVDSKIGDVAENIKALYDTMSTITEDFTTPDKTTKVITQFSDSVVISFKDDEKEGIISLFEQIQHLIVKLIMKGIICRGAISYGKLIHTEKVIFGPALVDAYETESKAAMYPRVVLDRSIVDKAKEIDTYKGKALSLSGDTADLLLESLTTFNLQKDTDEKFYIDYFFPIIHNYKEEPDLLKLYLSQLREIIQKGLRYQKPDLKVKYGWMKNKYNSMIENGIRGKHSVFTLINHPLYKDYLSTKLKPIQ